MKASANPHHKVSRPFIWQMAHYCLDLPGGAVRHFPAGTYNGQMETWAGRVELSLMDVAHSAWWTFIHQSMSDWKEGEREFVAWLTCKPKPEPTRLLDDLIARLWQMTWWARLILLPEREDET